MPFFVWFIDLQLPSIFTWLEKKNLMLNISLASAVRVKSLLYIFIFLSNKCSCVWERAKTESQIGQNLSKMQPQGLEM